MNRETIISRYASWLPFLAEADRDHVRSRHGALAEICANDPEAPRWGLLYYRWTAAALDSADPAAALREQVAAERGDPEEIDAALAGMDRTSDRWETRLMRSQVGEPYPLTKGINA